MSSITPQLINTIRKNKHLSLWINLTIAPNTLFRESTQPFNDPNHRKSPQNPSKTPAFTKIYTFTHFPVDFT
jgi:hypothetical protein